MARSKAPDGKAWALATSRLQRGTPCLACEMSRKVPPFGKFIRDALREIEAGRSSASAEQIHAALLEFWPAYKSTPQSLRRHFRACPGAKK